LGDLLLRQPVIEGHGAIALTAELLREIDQPLCQSGRRVVAQHLGHGAAAAADPARKDAQQLLGDLRPSLGPPRQRRPVQRHRAAQRHRDRPECVGGRIDDRRLAEEVARARHPGQPDPTVVGQVAELDPAVGQQEQVVARVAFGEQHVTRAEGHRRQAGQHGRDGVVGHADEKRRFTWRDGHPTAGTPR
jgi:hypothetical protein